MNIRCHFYGVYPTAQGRNSTSYYTIAGEICQQPPHNFAVFHNLATVFLEKEARRFFHARQDVSALWTIYEGMLKKKENRVLPCPLMLQFRYGFEGPPGYSPMAVISVRPISRAVSTAVLTAEASPLKAMMTSLEWLVPLFGVM